MPSTRLCPSHQDSNVVHGFDGGFSRKNAMGHSVARSGIAFAAQWH